MSEQAVIGSWQNHQILMVLRTKRAQTYGLLQNLWMGNGPKSKEYSSAMRDISVGIAKKTHAIDTKLQ